MRGARTEGPDPSTVAFDVHEIKGENLRFKAYDLAGQVRLPGLVLFLRRQWWEQSKPGSAWVLVRVLVDDVLLLFPSDRYIIVRVADFLRDRCGRYPITDSAHPPMGFAKFISVSDTPNRGWPLRVLSSRTRCGTQLHRGKSATLRDAGLVIEAFLELVCRQLSKWTNLHIPCAVLVPNLLGALQALPHDDGRSLLALSHRDPRRSRSIHLLTSFNQMTCSVCQRPGQLLRTTPTVVDPRRGLCSRMERLQGRRTGD